MAKRDWQRRMDTPGATVSNAAITVTSGGGGGGGMIAHDLFGPYHTGLLDRTQAPWVASDIATAIADHTAIVDAHHAKLHSVIDPAHHTVSGPQYGVVGLSAVNTLAVLPSANNLVSNPNTLMRSDASGGVTVAVLTAMTKVSTVVIDTPSGDLTIAPASTVTNVTGSLVATTKVRTPLLDSASGGIAITPANSVTTATGTLIVTVGVQTPLITTASNIDLTINPGGTGAVLFPLDQTLRTTTFDSGIPLITGWQINEVPGAAGYSSLTIGKIHANELMVDIFVANETRVDRGDQLWTKSYGILFGSFTTPSAIGGTTSIMFEDSPAITGAIFTNNDWLLLRKLDIDTGISLFNVWGQVASYVNNGDGSQSWTFTLRAGPPNKFIPAGSLGIDFGQSGQAFIHLSVIDPAGAPYLKLRKWVGADPFSPSNYTTYVQLGHLGSIGNPLYTPVGYGLYIRSMASAGQFIVADDNGLQLRGADFKEYNGSSQTVNISSADGSVKLGTDISNAATTTFDFNGATGSLAIKGNFITPQVEITTNYGVLVEVGSGIDPENGVNVNSIQWFDDISSPTGIPWFSIRGGKDGIAATGNLYAYAASDEAKITITARQAGQTQSTVTVRSESGSNSIIHLFSDTISLQALSGVVASSLQVTAGPVTVGGVAVSLSTHTHNDLYFTESESDTRYLAKTGGTLTGTLTVQSLIPSTDATYTLGSATYRFDDLYTANLHVDTIVGTPEFSHEHSANDITSGTLSSDRLPDTITKGLTLYGGVVLNADVASGNSAGLRILTDQTNNKFWDLIGRAQDYTTTADRNDLFLYQYNGSAFSVVFWVENTTRVVDFAATPTVNGVAVSLTSHNHDASYVPLARTVSAGAGLTGGGALSGNITLSHADTSTQVSSSNTGAAVMQNIILDTYGHVTGMTVVDLATTFDSSYVNVTGDTMTGTLILSMAADEMLRLASTSATGNPFIAFFQTVTRRSYIQHGDSGDILQIASEYGPIVLSPGSGGSEAEVFRVAPSLATVTGALTVTGFVGIGVAAISPLHVHTNAGYSGARFTSNATGTTASDGFWIGIDNLGGYVWNYENLPVIIATNNVSRFTVLAGGDITVNGGAIGAQNWLSGSTGWNITYAGAADLRSTNTTTLSVVGAATVGTTLQVTTSVSAPLYTAASGNLTVNSPSTLYLNAAVDRSVDLQVAGVTQWSATATQWLPRGSVLVDIGDYNRRVRTINAAELAVTTLVAQDVMATIGGRIIVAPTTTLIAETRGDQVTTLYTNLVSFWTMNEASGNRADSKGSNSLTDTNTVASAAGKYSNGALFVKANSERLTINDNTSLSVGDIDFYACAWIYPTLDDGTEHTIMSKAGASSNRAWRLWLDWATDQVKFQVYNSSNVATNLTATATILVNTWYFVEMWHDATANVIGVAVNGTSYTTAHTSGVKDDTGPFQIGAFNSTLFFNGIIDEVGFWKYMPTSYERTFLYNVGYGLNYTYIATACTLDTKHNPFGPGDYVYFTALAAGAPQTEVMRIGSAAQSIAGGYRYLASRNLDGGAANTWGAGDALVALGASQGEGYIELTSTSTIHNHYGPTLITYVRSSADTWNSVVPATANGNLRGLVDYAVDEFGQAAGNNLGLTPSTGFKGYTIDRTNGLRLFNTDFSIYESATKRFEVLGASGLALLADNVLTNQRQIISWYRNLDIKSVTPAASMLVYTSGNTNNMNLLVHRHDVYMGASMTLGAPTAYIALTENAGGSGSGTLAASSWSVLGSVNLNSNTLSNAVISATSLSFNNAAQTLLTLGISNWYMGVYAGSQALINFDGSDYILYDRDNDLLKVSVGAAERFFINNAGSVAIYPAAGAVGYIVYPAASSAQSPFLQSVDVNAGSSWAPYLLIGRNNNGSTPSAGWIRLTRRDGHGGDLWVDGSHVLRIGYDSAVTSATDTGGNVVGLQVSSLDQKDVLGASITKEQAITSIIETAKHGLRRFRYKSGAFGGEEFDGIITDFAPRYGMDRDAAHPAGRSLNMITVINDLILAVEYLYEKVQELSK